MTDFAVEQLSGQWERVSGSGYVIAENGALLIGGRYLGMGENETLARFGPGEWLDIKVVRP